MEVNIKRTFKDDDIKDLLCNALEGGSGYWCAIKRHENPDNVKCEYKHLDLPFTEKGGVIIIVPEDEDDKEYRLDRASMKKGLEIMAEKYDWHYRNFINDDADAETGDVFLQCSLLGDIIFG
jgi:hypothetical protein